MNIAPIKVKDLPAFLAAIEPIARELAEGDLINALAKHADRLIDHRRFRPESIHAVRDGLMAAGGCRPASAGFIEAGGRP